MKITDVRFAVIGLSPVLRILTDDPSIDGISQGEVPRNKVYLPAQLEYCQSNSTGNDRAARETPLSVMRL